MADFSRELWFASERSDEKQNIRMHQIRIRTFGCDLRTFGYEQRTMVSHPNSEIRIKWRWALSFLRLLLILNTDGPHEGLFEGEALFVRE